MHLILLNGQCVEVEIPEENEVDVVREVFSAFRMEDIWYAGNWSDVRVTYNEQELDYLDFHKVLGII